MTGIILKIKLLKVKCVFWFPVQACLKRLSFYEEVREIWSKMYVGRRVDYPLYLSDFNETWIFSADFRKIIK